MSKLILIDTNYQRKKSKKIGLNLIKNFPNRMEILILNRILFTAVNILHEECTYYCLDSKYLNFRF